MGSDNYFVPSGLRLRTAGFSIFKFIGISRSFCSDKAKAENVVKANMGRYKCFLLCNKHKQCQVGQLFNQESNTNNARLGNYSTKSQTQTMPGWATIQPRVKHKQCQVGQLFNQESNKNIFSTNL